MMRGSTAYHELKTTTPHNRDLRKSAPALGVSTGAGTLPAINKKALLNDTFQVPLKKKTSLTPLSNAPKTPKFNNFLASSDQTAPLSLTFGALELAITGGGHDEDVESMNISHFVKTPEHKRCVQMLTEGFVESFVDFFYLTHKKDPSNPEAKDSAEPGEKDPREEFSETSSSLHDMPSDVLDFLMERLSEAEDSQREGEASGVVKAYRELAAHFERNAEFNTAVHFHQKGLDASFRLGDSTHAADSYRCIGVDYENMGNIPLAIEYFDKYSDLAQKSPNNKQAIATSFKHLVIAYRTFAEQLEEKAAIDGSQETLRSAVEYYIKCLAMAKNCSDSTAEGTVNYRLGLVYKQLGKPDLSIKHLQNYMYLCRINGDSAGESAACSALADSYMSSSDIHQSVKYLEDNIALAQRTNQPTSQAHACRDLGVIYDQQEDYEKALEYFEKYYKLALETKDRSLVDNARVYLGIARGNIKLMRMFNIPNHSITPATMKPIPPATPNTNSGMQSARSRGNAAIRAETAPAKDNVKDRKDGTRSPSGTPRQSTPTTRAEGSPRSARAQRSAPVETAPPQRPRTPTSPLSARRAEEHEQESPGSRSGSPRVSTPPSRSHSQRSFSQEEQEEEEEQEQEETEETPIEVQHNAGTPRRSPSATHTPRSARVAGVERGTPRTAREGTPRSARGAESPQEDETQEDTSSGTPRSARGAVESGTPRSARGDGPASGIPREGTPRSKREKTPRSARGEDTGAIPHTQEDTSGTPRSARGDGVASRTPHKEDTTSRTPRSARIDAAASGTPREGGQRSARASPRVATPARDEGAAPPSVDEDETQDDENRVEEEEQQGETDLPLQPTKHEEVASRTPRSARGDGPVASRTPRTEDTTSKTPRSARGGDAVATGTPREAGAPRSARARVATPEEEHGRRQVVRGNDVEPDGEIATRGDEGAGNGDENEQERHGGEERDEGEDEDYGDDDDDEPDEVRDDSE